MSDNLVEMVFRGHVPGTVELSEGTPIVIVCKNDICLALVPENLVPVALSKRCGCCGSEYNCFRLATIEEVKKFNE